MKRKILAFLIAGILFCLSGCTKTDTGYVYDTTSKISEVSSTVVAENDTLLLEWNNDRKYITVTSKATGDVWSTTPQDFLNSEVKRNKNLEAPLNVKVFNPEDKSVTVVSGYSYAVSSGRVGSEKISNGIKVIYYFDKFNLSIPVKYTLKNDFLNITVVTEEIVENNFKVVEVSIAPSFCSVKNGSEDSYIFVPSGSGAIMECYQSGDKSRSYSGNIYGIDKSRIIIDKWFYEEEINLPVFGVKNGNSALFGIVDSYEGAVLNAEAGNGDTGFSNIYPTFELRGYDEKETAKTEKYIMYSDDISICEDISINYYLLHGDNVGYQEMALVYRNYLIEKYKMEKSNICNDVLLNFYGGDYVNDFVLGVPYEKMSVLTQYSDVLAITEEIITNTDMIPNVQLSGFTDSGLSKGKIGGGFRLSNTFGNKKELENLKTFIKEKGGNLFADFDIVNYNSSSDGYNTLFSAAKTANQQRMKFEPVSKDVHTKSLFDKEYYLLGRKHLYKAADKLKKYLNSADFNSVSLESLGKTAYSDYADLQYYSKGNTANQIAEILSSFEKEDIAVLVSDANDYSVSTADAVADVAFSAGNYSVFDYCVPFYQMVFSGYKQLYSVPANEQSSITDVLLDCVSTGMGMSFSIIDTYDNRLAPKETSYVSKSVFQGNKKYIIEALNKYKTFTNNRDNSTLVSFRQLDNGLTESIFDNGLTVYVNKTDFNISFEDITVNANSFKMKGVE